MFLLSLLPLPILSAAFPWSSPTNTLTITVDASKKFQQFDGLGFSEAFQRCTQIYGSSGLSPENTTRVLDLLFSDTVGMGAKILRNGIGSSPDHPYDLMMSIEPDSPGSPDAPPHYVWDGWDNGQVQLTKDARARGLKYIYADAWSAAGYMKNNTSDDYGGYLCGVRGISCPTGDWRQAYANYLVQYLKFYEQEGIHIDVVGFLNEPDLNVSYASMESSGEQAADFLVKLYPTIQQSGLGTKIACCDGSGWEQARERIEGIQAVGDEYTIDIATAHGYDSPLGTPFQTTKRVWQTEWADLTGPYTLAWYSNGSTGEGLTWANHIQSAFVVSNCSAFLHWIGGENATTGNSMLIHLPGDNVIVSKRLWAFAQFSRFVKPDARRIAASTSNPGVNVTVSAFENIDGSVAVQVINNTDDDQTVDIAGLWRESVKAWVTNNDEDMTEVHAQSSQGRPGGTVQARSMVSYVSAK